MRIEEGAGRSLSGRYFNRVVYDPIGRRITKTSSNEQKLRDEILWYLELPIELRNTIPRVMDYSLESNRVSITLQYIPQATAGEMLADNLLSRFKWANLLIDLRKMLDDYASYTSVIPPEHAQEMYFVKTENRMLEALKDNRALRAFYDRGYFRLNGITTICPIRLFFKSKDVVNKLADGLFPSLMHGDLCFSNLFYRPDRDSAFIVIDPRGRFGRQGIYGDQRYDMAKVRHSLSGYEHIVRDKYTMRYDASSIELEIGDRVDRLRLKALWDSMLGKRLGAVKLIEALLFLSMLPLHRDDPNRQIALYALGSELLLEAVQE